MGRGRAFVPTPAPAPHGLSAACRACRACRAWLCAAYSATASVRGLLLAPRLRRPAAPERFATRIVRPRADNPAAVRPEPARRAQSQRRGEADGSRRDKIQIHLTAAVVRSTAGPARGATRPEPMQGRCARARAPETGPARVRRTRRTPRMRWTIRVRRAFRPHAATGNDREGSAPERQPPRADKTLKGTPASPLDSARARPAIVLSTVLSTAASTLQQRQLH